MLKYNTAEMLQAQAAGQWDRPKGDVLQRNLDESLRILRDTSTRFKRRFHVPESLEPLRSRGEPDVHLNLWTGADGVWLEELLDLPTPPAMPKRRDLLDFGRHRQMPYVNPGTFRVASRDSDGPNVSEAEPKCVKYWENRVTHHVPRELSPVYFQFTADETVGSFSINYRLVAANIREPQEGTVHVKLSLGEAQAPPVPGSEAEE